MRAFVDRPLSDLVGATALAEQAAKHWRLAPPVLLRRGMNAIFRSEDTVLRVSEPSAPAGASLDLARMLRAEGVCVARPRRDDVVERGVLAVTAWEHVEDIDEPTDWTTVGAMVRHVHGLDQEQLPATYPTPRPTDFPWWRFERLLADVGHAIDDEAVAGLRAAIDRWPDWADPYGAVVCHGDVHPGNVIMSRDGPVLIDWDLLCLAPPGWDHGPMMTWADRWGGREGEYEQFADGYGTELRGDPSAEAFAELRLVAATLMRVKAGLMNDTAMPEARRRLAHWRGETDAPVWQAQ